MSSNEELQRLTEYDNITVAGRVTVSFEIAHDHGTSMKEIEDNINDWFKNYPMSIKIYGHAARESLMIGNSGKLEKLELFFRESLSGAKERKDIFDFLELLKSNLPEEAYDENVDSKSGELTWRMPSYNGEGYCECLYDITTKEARWEASESPQSGNYYKEINTIEEFNQAMLDWDEDATNWLD